MAPPVHPPAIVNARPSALLRRGREGRGLEERMAARRALLFRIDCALSRNDAARAYARARAVQRGSRSPAFDEVA